MEAPTVKGSSFGPEKQNPKELALRFAAFLLRTMGEFPSTARLLGERISAQALLLVDAVLQEERPQKELAASPLLKANPGLPTPFTFSAGAARIFHALELYLGIAQDSGYIPNAIHHIALDVVQELRGHIAVSSEFIMDMRHPANSLHKLSGSSYAEVVPHGAAIPYDEEPITDIHHDVESSHHEVERSTLQGSPEPEPPGYSSGQPNAPLRDREATLLMLLKEKNPRRFKELRPFFPVSDRALRKDMARLVSKGKVIRRGEPPQSWYELV